LDALGWYLRTRALGCVVPVQMVMIAEIIKGERNVGNASLSLAKLRRKLVSRPLDPFFFEVPLAVFPQRKPAEKANPILAGVMVCVDANFGIVLMLM
jgi:hypothetical protein